MTDNIKYDRDYFNSSYKRWYAGLSLEAKTELNHAKHLVKMKRIHGDAYKPRIMLSTMTPDELIAHKREGYKKANARRKINNPDKTKANKSMYKARERIGNKEGCFNKADVLKMLAIQKNKCAFCYCDIKDIYHLDHIIPLSKNGTNCPSNIQLLCPKCNVTKSDKLLYLI